jgi:ABC-type nitrate/sulfonate/bicarbonate transport system ATPase subunit
MTASAVAPAVADDMVLEFSGIGQSFGAPGGGAPLVVLENISFDVPRGGFVAVIGPSGCGKSTLLQMAAGLLAPTAGEVRHRGRRIAQVNHEVGFVPQQAQLFPWKTLLENVAFPLALRGVAAAEREQRAAAAIAAVDLAGFERHYPYQLSGGMQKRASIARTMVYRPDAILMDEPFGALDAQTRMRMQNDLQSLVTGSGAAVLFVTHDITEAVLLADAVVVLSRRPTHRIATVKIDLPRPRDVFEPFAVPGFAAAYDAVWQHFRTEIDTGRNSAGRHAA